MIDPVTAVSSALASIKTAADIARLLKNTDISLEKAELKLKLAEMISALAEAKIEMAQVQGLIAEKDRVIKELGEKLVVKGEMRYQAPFYWRIHGDEKEGPFCQKCYDCEGKLIRLRQRGGRDEWDCLQCGVYFTGPGYAPPSDQRGPYDRWDRWRRT